MLSPEEVIERKCKNIPNFIYTAINNLLMEKYDLSSGKAIITNDEVCKRVDLVSFDKKQVIRWFSSAAFEYRTRGWKVTNTEMDGGGIVFKGV